MKTVAQLLKRKPAGVISIRPDAPVLEALKLLADRDVGAVLAMDGSRLVGIVSERDYTAGSRGVDERHDRDAQGCRL